MKIRRLYIIPILLLTFISTNAQFDAIKARIKGNTQTEQPKPTPTPRQPPASNTAPDPVKYANEAQFLFIGANDLEGRKAVELRVCTEGHSLRYPIQDKFKQWINELSETAMLKMLEMGRCELLGYRIVDNPGYKHRNADSFAEEAQGKTVFKVESDAMVAVKKFGTSQFYIVVVPEINKPGLRLADLNLCGSPDTVKNFRRKAAGVSNCHDLQQSIYTLESYKSYPGPMQRNSVIFNSTDFEALKKQGKFKAFAIYKLVGEDLVPSK